MNVKNPAPTIRNSDLKGFKVLIVDSDQNRGIRHETQAELDKDLQRIQIFYVSSVREARNLIKTRRPNLAIFPGDLEGQDFVTLQLEFKNANPSTGLVPLVETPNLQQYRESRRIGGVIDFAPPETLENYEQMRDLVIQVCRILNVLQPGFEDGLKQTLGLQRALIISNPTLKASKNESAIICREMASWYDLGPQEVIKLILAEKLFLPELTAAHYDSLLGEDTFGLRQTLGQTASWVQSGSIPQSTSGLIITCSNYISHCKSQNVSTDEINERLQKRPHFLKHVSIRVMRSDRIVTLLTQLDTMISESALG